MAPSPFALPLLELREQLQIRQHEAQRQLYDPIRRKWLVMQPEETVRQLLLIFLTREKGYSPNRIGVEKTLSFNGLTRRFDILVYDPAMQPWMLVECKAPGVPISQDTFDQAARYNLPLRVPYLVVSNGRDTYCCKMDYENEGYDFLEGLPEFPK
jgi:hypothetical protein